MKKPKIKILIVDDEPDILEFLRYNFEKENYDVSTAKNGLKAIHKAKKNSPDLIILDVMMPDLDGIEVCRQLRNQLAHGVVYPGSSDKHARDDSENITIMYFGEKKWEKKNFSKKDQKELDEMVYRTYRRIREMYRFVVESHGEYSLLAI